MTYISTSPFFSLVTTVVSVVCACVNNGLNRAPPNAMNMDFFMFIYFRVMVYDLCIKFPNEISTVVLFSSFSNQFPALITSPSRPFGVWSSLAILARARTISSVAVVLFSAIGRIGLVLTVATEISADWLARR
ncbi:hypothetical protein D3C72_1755740 [compost metagenome]